MMIHREVFSQIKEKLFKHKVIILFGARQTGKTTLLKELIEDYNKPYLWLNADEPDIRAELQNTNSVQLKNIIGKNKLVCIDEAQRVKNIGLTLKIIHDTFPEIQVIATGSSSFELANQINEPLTGRKFEFKIFPISFNELAKTKGALNEKRNLEHRLLYGSYPEIINNHGEEKEILLQLSDSYLYKDILLWENIKKPDKLIILLQALAFQIGNQVSYSELSKFVGLDSKTIESYIQLLEKSFVIFRLSSFSRNLRNELKFSKKIYFYDNGIRNSIISNFQSVKLRNDIGALWENYLISERIKKNFYSKNYANIYFWRTKEKKEIDLIEEKDNQINAYEFKWNENSKAKITKTFTANYPNAKVQVITPQNYVEFLT